MLSKFVCYIVIFCFFVISSIHSYEYELSICAAFQDEAPYLKEWIEYHKIVGVEHFYLYNHYSSDNFQEVLQPYVECGEVTLLNWETELFRHAQLEIYNDGLVQGKNVTKWLAFIDIDEFLLPMKSPDLVSFLKPFERKKKVAAITVNWQLYGTSWIKKLNPEELLVKQLTLKASKKHTRNRFYKSIVRPEFTIKARNPHWFSYAKGFYAVDPDGKKVKTIIHKGIPVDKLRINHYWLRDEEFTYSTKVKRLMHVYGWTEEKAREFIEKLFVELNAVEDLSIFPYIPDLEEAVFADESSTHLYR